MGYIREYCQECQKEHMKRTVCDEVARPVDGLVMRAEIRNTRGPTDEYEMYLVLRSGDKTWPYIYIPETLPDDVLEAVLAKLNA